MEPTTKTCSTCKQERSLEDYSPDKTRGGLQRQCRPCRAEYMRGYNVRNRERVRLNVTLRAWGLTAEQHAALVEAQGGVCALCKRPPRPAKRLCLDHDHATGRVRGLLCQDCNLGIGQLRDDADLLEAAAAYVRSGGVLADEHAFTVDPATHGARRTDIRRRARQK